MSNLLTFETLVHLRAKVSGMGVCLQVSWRWFLLETLLPMARNNNNADEVHYHFGVQV